MKTTKTPTDEHAVADGPRLGARSAALDAMRLGYGKFRIGRARREEMVDGAMAAVEEYDPQTEGVARHFAIEGARANAGSGIIAWIAMQVFIRVAVFVIIKWWMDQQSA